MYQRDVAAVVVNALRAGELHFHRYQLHSYVVMPNHVHILITPHVVSTKWLGPLKEFPAYEANQILGTRGLPFWQDESYDHLVRSGGEFDRIQSHIENNPLKAGLAVTAAEFRWSSAA